MRLADGGIDKDVFEVRVLAQRFEKILPNPGNRPAPEARVDRAPIPQLRRQVTPRRCASRQPKDRVEEQSIVGTGPSTIPLFAWNQGRDDRPLPVCQSPPAQERLPFLILNQTESDLGIP